MDEQTRRKSEETVTEILREADMEAMTEFKVRVAASESLGLDLSNVEHKNLVRGVVESFLLSMVDDSVDGKYPNSIVQEESKEATQELREAVKEKEVDVNGERHICELSGRGVWWCKTLKGNLMCQLWNISLEMGRGSPHPKFSRKAGNAKELWEELKIVYLGTRRAQVRQYLEFQMEEGKPIPEQVPSFSSFHPPGKTSLSSFCVRNICLSGY